MSVISCARLHCIVLWASWSGSESEGGVISRRHIDRSMGACCLPVAVSAAGTFDPSLQRARCGMHGKPQMRPNGPRMTEIWAGKVLHRPALDPTPPSDETNVGNGGRAAFSCTHGCRLPVAAQNAALSTTLHAPGGAPVLLPC